MPPAPRSAVQTMRESASPGPRPSRSLFGAARAGGRGCEKIQMVKKAGGCKVALTAASCDAQGSVARNSTDFDILSQCLLPAKSHGSIFSQTRTPAVPTARSIALSSTRAGGAGLILEGRPSPRPLQKAAARRASQKRRLLAAGAQPRAACSSQASMESTCLLTRPARCGIRLSAYKRACERVGCTSGRRRVFLSTRRRPPSPRHHGG